MSADKKQTNNNKITPGFTPASKVPVGGIILAKDTIDYNTDRKTVTLTIKNTGDRPIQIGSHFHFFEVNRYLEFDRSSAFGYHLNIPATTAIRFEPGEAKQVELVSFGGKQRIIGFNNLVDGYTGDEDAPSFFPASIRAIRRLDEFGFKTTSQKDAEAKNKTNTNNTKK